MLNSAVIQCGTCMIIGHSGRALYSPLVDDSSSAQSSEIFAHRIKELTDREEAIAKRQKDRRSGRYPGHVPDSSSRTHDGDDGCTVDTSAASTDHTYISNITER